MLVNIEKLNDEIMWVYGPFKNTKEAQEHREKREAEIIRLRGTPHWVKEPREINTLALVPVV